MIKCEVVMADPKSDGLLRMQFMFPIVPRKGDVIVIPYGSETFEVTEVQITSANMGDFDEATAVSLTVV